MTNTAKQVLTILDAAISPAKPKPAPLPPDPGPRVITPTWAILGAVLKSAGLPDKATTAKLETLGLAWKAELAGLKGYSHTDARREWKTALSNAISSKGNAKALPTSKEIIDRNSQIRNLVRRRAANISREASLIAAEVLEQAARHLPQFKKDLIAQQSAILPELEAIKGKSALEMLCDELPSFIETHVRKLRENLNPMTDPAQLLK